MYGALRCRWSSWGSPLRTRRSRCSATTMLSLPSTRWSRHRAWVLDDGTVLMDSTLMLEYLEPLAPPARRLMPQAPADRARALRVIGLALAACEKSVQIVYENLRPADKRDPAWLDRVHRQLLAAYRLLESECARGR